MARYPSSAACCDACLGDARRTPLFCGIAMRAVCRSAVVSTDRLGVKSRVLRCVLCGRDQRMVLSSVHVPLLHSLFQHYSSDCPSLYRDKCLVCSCSIHTTLEAVLHVSTMNADHAMAMVMLEALRHGE